MTQNAKYSSVLIHLFFFVLAVLLLFYYDYFTLLTSPPVGTHIWRQTDSLSFAWTYWKNGLDFFHPQLLNRSFGDGYAVSEFPILQYIIAVLFSIFGFHWWIAKFVYVIVYFLGLIAIFRITRYYTQDLFWSYFMMALFFTAPSLVFYGNSCIPDVPALSFSFIGYAFFLDFTEKNKKWFLWASMFFFCLSGLMKLTYLLLFMAMLCVLATDYLFKTAPGKFRNIRWLLLAFFLVFVINALWLVWVDHYNVQNQYLYFLNKINPFWKESTEKGYILKRTVTEWARYLFTMPVHIISFLSLLLIPFSRGKGNNMLKLITVILLLGTIAYYLLWYLQFLVHDYYTILFYAFYLFAILNILVLMKEFFPRMAENNIIRTMAIVLIVTNALQVKESLSVRYEDAHLYPVNKYLQEDGLVPYIRKLGIKEDEKIIAIPDASPQTILCALQTPGFTEYNEHYTIDNLKEFKAKGVKFLIIIDQKPYQELIKQLGIPAGIYKDALIFRL